MSNSDGQLIAAVLSEHPSTGRRIAALLDEGGIRALKCTRRSDDLEGSVGDRPADVFVLVCPTASIEARRAILDLKRRFSGVPVVAVVRDRNASRAARAALDANAEGVVYWGRVEEALVPTVWAVSAQQVVLPRSEHRRGVPAAFSHRERQVLRLAVAGMTNDSIARELYLSCSTVKSHLTSAFAKLSVRSRSEAAAVLSDPDEPARRLIFSTGGSGAAMSAAGAGGRE